MPIHPIARYELPAGELADWLETQGQDHWWSVDGDPLLMGRLSFPTPGDELAGELRRINQPIEMLGQQSVGGSGGGLSVNGQLGAVVEELAETDERGDRVLLLRWKGEANEWLLVEDSEAAETMAAAEQPPSRGCG